jgi:hypothetical protein
MQSRLREVSTFHAVEFSKTAPLGGNKKPLTRIRGLRGPNTEVVSARSKALQFVELQASYTLLAEGRGMVAQEIPLSTKPFFATLAPGKIRVVSPFPGGRLTQLAIR